MTQVRIYFPNFYGSKMEEDFIEFVEKISRVLNLVIVIPVEKAEVFVIHLKEISQNLYSQLKCERPVEASPMKWERYKNGFIDRFTL